MNTTLPTPRTSRKSAKQLIAAVSITLPPILRQMVDDMTGAAGRSFQDFQTELAEMIVHHLQQAAHWPTGVPVCDVWGMDETIDDDKLAAAQSAVEGYRARLPKPRF